MFAKFSRCLLIVALLGATGIPWTLLQSIAWVSMFADNACTTSLPAALEKTFDGNHPCAMCQAIAQGRRAEKKSEVQVDLKKLEFIQTAIVFFIQAPHHFILTSERIAHRPLLNSVPPVPPPRTLPG